MKYTFWFEQVNQYPIEANARTPQKALEKAEREWRRDNKYPKLQWAEDEKHNYPKGLPE
jgi:hypothetical protein